jgi:hypothetical protein
MRTFHRDVKPGNVLLTLQHGPQLLDFNLAESPHATHHAESAMLGGTLPYMAPEQIEAFLDPELWGKVSARSDLYSLGLVLRELLTGAAPDLPDEKLPPTRAMRELLDRRVCLNTDVGAFNPNVPFALRSIVDRCLKLDPDERYGSARALSEDLRRFLSREPLVTARNPSRRERTANWLVRHRRELATRSVIVALAGMLALSWLGAILKPDPVKHPMMQQAAEALNAGRADQAIAPLRKLVYEYPDHPLPRTVLGIAEALSTSLKENEAQLDVVQGLSLPEAEPLLLGYGRKHPELPAQLERVVDNQIANLNDLKARQGISLKAAGQARDGADHRDLEQDRATERRLHETWLKLVNLGLKLNPQSDRLQNKRIELDEFFELYDSAYEQLSTLIESRRTAAQPVHGSEQLDLLTRRNRVAVKWARNLLRSRDPADIRRAVDVLERAGADLLASESILSALVSQQTVKPVADLNQSIYKHLWIGTETWLGLAEAHEVQGRPDQAEAAGRKADSYFRRLVKYGTANMVTHPSTLQDLDRRVASRRAKRPESHS